MSRPRRSASSLDLPEPLFGSDRRTSSVRRRSVSPGRENASANGRASFAPAKRNARRSISQATLPTDAAVNGDTEVPANEAQVCVAVRVRPFSAKEVAAGSTARRTVSVLDNRKIVFDPLAAKVVDDGGPEGPTFRVPGTRREKNVCYTFDRVFAETATQQEVYEGSAKPLIDAVLGGYNSTVFAYGATGCGKTHTIVGTQEDPGLIVRMMEDLFERMSALEGDRVIEAQFSYLEVYNEIIRDLLMPDAAPAGLDVREDDHGVVVAGLSLHAFSDPTAVMDMLLRGNSNRSKAPTEANQASSRSHAVLQVHIQHKDRASGTHSSWTKAVLSIIDLAGSERASVTKNRGERLHEGAKINRSLLALGNCINALCKPGATAQHVPYRDSKLTRLLKHSLGGNCRVVMIANISPHPMHYEETHNTLMYANRAKQIRTRSEVNRVEVEAGVDQYVKIIADLREQVHSLKQKLVDGGGQGSVGLLTDSAANAVSRTDLGSLRDNLLPALLKQLLVCLAVNERIAELERRLAIVRGVVDVFWGPGADAQAFDAVREDSASLAEELEIMAEMVRERKAREDRRLQDLESAISAEVQRLEASCMDSYALSEFVTAQRLAIDLQVAREESRLLRARLSGTADFHARPFHNVSQFVALIGQQDNGMDTSVDGETMLGRSREDGASLIRESILSCASLQHMPLDDLSAECDHLLPMTAPAPSLPMHDSAEPMTEDEEDARFAAQVAAEERILDAEEEQTWEAQADTAMASLRRTPTQSHGVKHPRSGSPDGTELSPMERRQTVLGLMQSPSRKLVGTQHRSVDFGGLEPGGDGETPKPVRAKTFTFDLQPPSSPALDLLRSSFKNNGLTPPDLTPKADSRRGAPLLTMTAASPAPDEGTPRAAKLDLSTGGAGPIRLDSPARRRGRRSMIPLAVSGPPMLAKHSAPLSPDAAPAALAPTTAKRASKRRSSVLPPTEHVEERKTRSRSKKTT